MSDINTPNIFRFLLSDMSIENSDIAGISDGFFMVNKSISNILSSKGILDFPDSSGERLDCNKFFDDWFLYAVPNDNDYTYSLLKLREQEHDTEDGTQADGDTPGVTISFISFNSERIYDLSAKYNTLNATVYGLGDGNSGSLKIYADGVCVYSNTSIDTNTRPFKIALDVIGVMDLKFEMKQEYNSYTGECFGLSNIYVQKTVK